MAFLLAHRSSIDLLICTMWLPIGILGPHLLSIDGRIYRMRYVKKRCCQNFSTSIWRWSWASPLLSKSKLLWHHTYLYVDIIGLLDFMTYVVLTALSTLMNYAHAIYYTQSGPICISRMLRVLPVYLFEWDKPVYLLYMELILLSALRQLIFPYGRDTYLLSHDTRVGFLHILSIW